MNEALILYVRAVLYRYSSAKPGNPRYPWWTRQRIGLWIPPLSANDLTVIEYLKVKDGLDESNC